MRVELELNWASISEWGSHPDYACKFGAKAHAPPRFIFPALSVAPPPPPPKTHNHFRRVFDEIRDRDVVCLNSYLDALCKNGELGAAVAVCEMMPVRGVVTRTSMINGFKREGRFLQANKLP